MATTRDLVNTWNKYKTVAKIHFDNTTNLVLEHNERLANQNIQIKKEKQIDKSKDVLTTMLTVNQRLAFFDHEFKKLGDEGTKLLKEVKFQQKVFLANTIQLIKLIADKYFYLKESSTKTSHKKTFIAQAHQYAQQALALYNGNSAILGANHDPTMQSFVKKITDDYHFWHMEDSNDPIQQILVSAKNVRDSEQAFAEFQRAFELAVKLQNTAMQFTIAYEQGRNYCEQMQAWNNNFLNAERIQARQAIVKKVCDTFVIATEIKLKHFHNTGQFSLECDGLYVDFFNFANHLSFLSKEACIAKNFDMRINLLKDSSMFLDHAEKLIKYVKVNIENLKPLQQLIATEINAVQAEQAKVAAEKVEKEKQRLLLEQSKKDYEENFASILESIIKEENTTPPHAATPKTAKELSADKSSSLQENENLVSSVDPESRNNLKRAYFHYIIFNESGERRSGLRRTQSFGSYFDDEESLLRDDNRKGFGR